MHPTSREPSMEEILASIKEVIAQDKGARAGEVRGQQPLDVALSTADEDEEAVLELDEPLAPPIETGPPLLDQAAAAASRSALEQLSTVAASVPAPPQTNPLEDMVREMLRPILKQWLDEHLPEMVENHVMREITRITGKPL
jgi:cell pole-organizing protein PopZ